MAVQKKTGKVNKNQAAQELAEKMRLEREAKAKKSRYIFGGVIGSIVLLVVIAIVIVVITNPNSESNQNAKIEEQAQSGEAPTANWTTTGANAGSLIISKNGVGDDKAIKNVPTLDIYNDFICPACALFENSYSSTIAKIISDGTANIRYHPLSWFDNTSRVYVDGKVTAQSYGYSSRAAAAAYYIGDKAPDKYLDFMEAMYKTGNQPSEGDKYTQASGTNEAIAKIIVSAGISESIAKAAVGLSGNAVTPDWANEFKGAASQYVLPGTQAGPYIRYAETVGAKIKAGNKVTATPAVFITSASGQETTFEVGKGSPESLVAALAAAK
jgi:protein-disulfide isomerase